jgi:UDP-4-amino-4-deoxy-L-arabinose-oxoglutarate aminotransferase
VQGRSPQAEVQEPGYKYNLTDLASALGLAQLKRLNELNERRRQWASLYREKLADVEEILLLADPPYPMRHAWHLLVVRLDTDRAGLSRDRLMEELKQRNIGTGLHFRAVHTQAYYRERTESRRHPLPNTEWNSQRILSLPLFPDLAAQDVEDVVTALKDVLSKA